MRHFKDPDFRPLYAWFSAVRGAFFLMRYRFAT
jgi:hypothetical protein